MMALRSVAPQPATEIFDTTLLAASTKELMSLVPAGSVYSQVHGESVSQVAVDYCEIASCCCLVHGKTVMACTCGPPCAET